MKRSLVVAAIAVLSIVIPSSIPGAAQAATTALTTLQDAPGMQAGPNTGRMLHHLSKRLGLSDDQKAKIAPILADRQEKLKALRDDTSTPRKQKRQTMMSIHQDSDAKINAILTPDQQKQYQQMQEEMRQKAHNRHDAQGSDDSQPSPQTPQ